MRIVAGHRRAARSRGRRIVGWLVLALLVALPALAHAAPGDPTWIAGMYDDADGDDLVALAASAEAVPGMPAELVPALVACPAAAPDAQVLLRPPAPSPVHSRAPPAR